MFTLHIEHAVTDFATWQEAFDRFADLRRKAGVRQHRVQRPIQDPLYVVIDLDFISTSEAESFLRYLQTEVWVVPGNSPALVGMPQSKILYPAAVREQSAPVNQPLQIG